MERAHGEPPHGPAELGSDLAGLPVGEQQRHDDTAVGGGDQPGRGPDAGTILVPPAALGAERGAQRETASWLATRVSRRYGRDCP